jgi:hypothetical protein
MDKSYADMTPAERIEWTVENGRMDEIGDLLLQYIADYGVDDIDAQGLARRVWDRMNEEEG